MTVLIVSTMTVVSLHRFEEADLAHYRFLNDYLLKQTQAFTHKRKEYIGEYGISLNENGHPRVGQTLHFDHHEVIIHLGNGYATLE